MITRHVRLAFERLAVAQGAEALLEMAENASENPTRADTDAFLDKLTEVDPDIRQLRDTARSDDFLAAAGEGIGGKVDVLHEAIEDALTCAARGVPGKATEAVSSGDIGKLVDVLRYLLEKKSRGEDRTTMSVGLREQMSEIHALSAAGEEIGRAVNDLLESKFAGEIPSFVEAYKKSKPPGSGKTRWQLLREQLGAGAQAAAEATVLQMVYKSLRRMIDNENYADKNDDMHAFNAVLYPVRMAIQSGVTGDEFDPQHEESGTRGARRNWARYVGRLAGLPQFGGRGLDRQAVLEWINENFVRPELAAGTMVTAPRFPGDSEPVTAPPLRHKLTLKTLNRWFLAVTPVRSLEERSDEEGVSLGEQVETRDIPLEQREEYRVEYLSKPEKRQEIRKKVEQYVKRAVDEVPVGRENQGIEATNLKPVYEHILLVKLGLGSDIDRESNVDRKKFEDAWIANEKDLPHLPFKTEMMSKDMWQSLGRPLRRGYENDPDQAPHNGYIKRWTQTVLVNRQTGNEIKGIDELRAADRDGQPHPDKGAWKLVKKIHKAGEKPSRNHFANWSEYTEEDRRDDIRQTLDAYDGQAWLERSLTEDAQEALKSDVEEGKAIGHIDPSRVFKGWAKNVDIPLLRAVGLTRQTVAVQYGSLFPHYPSIAWDMRKVMNKFTALVDEDVKQDVPGADWVWVYLFLKGTGKIASARAFRKEAMDRVIRSVVAALMRNAA